MAEPGRRSPRSRGGGGGARRARVARGRCPRAPQAPSLLISDTVLVDLVSDSDEEILGVVTDPVEMPAARSPAPAAPGQDSDSNSEGENEGPAGAPRPLVRRRRRRLLDPGEAPVVPVYSGKVQSSLNLIPDNSSLLKFCLSEPEDEADVTESGNPPPDALLPGSPWKKKLRSNHEKEETMEALPDQDVSPLPWPSPRNKSRKHSEALKKLREVNKRLQDLRSCLSPNQHQSPARQSLDDEVVLVEEPALPQSPRPFTLKIRCRADLVRLPVMTSEPLQNVVDYMANHLGVSPSRILLLFGETELSPTATPRALKLGVADIIDCVVLASSSEATETSQQLQLRVQGKEKHQMMEISLSPDSPLKVLMSHYEETMGLSGHKLSFFFDGTKLSGKELPADLGMESGDLIEVWG
ncbi:NFATC2-interacting protein [Chionomys nivalis]|uniref:NFATC2-interacting protein n=1 Tax=Chionomys nivalis TaxID=269649 RepID=UPI002598D330|nr:NFATC2-interacting protein [Chionomys nivalis]